MTAILAWYKSPDEYGIAADSWVSVGDGVGWERRKIISDGPIAIAGTGTIAILQRLEREIMVRLTPEMSAEGVLHELRKAWAEVLPRCAAVEPRYLPETGCTMLVVHPAGLFQLWPAGETTCHNDTVWRPAGNADDYLFGWLDGNVQHRLSSGSAGTAREALTAACARVTGCRPPVVVWTPPR